MFKKTFLLGIIFSSQLFTSEQPQEINIITIEEIPWVESREASEVNNDSFCVSVISYIDPTDIEILDENNMMGN